MSLGFKWYIICVLLAWPTSTMASDISHPAWRVGQWAAYHYDAPDGSSALFELAIVGRQRIAGRMYFWCELSGKEDGQPVVVKQLVTPDLTHIRTVLVQHGSRLPVSLRSGSWVRFDDGIELKSFFPGTSRARAKALMVYGGRFQARCSSGPKGQYCLSPRVPITGLVQLEPKAGGKIQLIASGWHGGRSSNHGPRPPNCPRPRLYS